MEDNFGRLRNYYIIYIILTVKIYFPYSNLQTMQFGSTAIRLLLKVTPIGRKKNYSASALPSVIK